MIQNPARGRVVTVLHSPVPGKKVGVERYLVKHDDDAAAMAAVTNQGFVKGGQHLRAEYTSGGELENMGPGEIRSYRG